MKKLITLALASATALSLAGCGSDSAITLDTSVMTNGESNKTGLGGYWFTYVDRARPVGGVAVSNVVPNTGKVSPLDPISTGLNPGLTDGVGKGVEDDGTGNKALHVTGTVGAAPKYDAKLGDAPVASGDWRDLYQDGLEDGAGKTFGADLCVGGLCGNVAYPSAGIGFGFKANNALLNTDAAGYIGVGFKIKLGATHGSIAGVSNAVSVSLPMDLTDVPDHSFNDQFGSLFAPSTPLHSGVAAPAGANVPICSFANSIKADNTPVGGSKKTCYGNLATIVTPAPVATGWTTYCATWDAFKAPLWGGSGAAIAEAGVTAIDPARLIKMQFDAYKPTDLEGAANFDFYVDDVKLLDATSYNEYCVVGGAQVVAHTDVP